jgi:hypothetical protein
LIGDSTSNCQSCGARARALFVRVRNPYAVIPISGPETIDHTIRLASSVYFGTAYAGSLPSPDQATPTAIPAVATAGSNARSPKVRSSTSSANMAPPSGALYTAARPAPAAHATITRLSSTVSRARSASQPAYVALSSRGPLRGQAVSRAPP